MSYSKKYQGLFVLSMLNQGRNGAYLARPEIRSQAQQINWGFDLNHYEIQLLDLTAAAYSLGQPIFIGDLIYPRHITSQAALHASVKKLIAKELLCIKPHEGDGRTKELRLTTPAIDRYKRLQKAMRRALTK